MLADVEAIVPGYGVRAPTLVSGSGAQRFVEAFSRFGMPTSAVSDTAGDAASRKLVRSVAMKGLAAVVIEAMQAAEAAGCSDWLWQNLGNQIAAADEKFLPRLVRGTHAHALRRLHEMEASAELLDSLGVQPIMTASTVENLQKVLSDWPDAKGDAEAGGKSFPSWWDKI